MDKQRLVNEKRAIDLLGMPYLDHNDKKVVQHVIRSLKGTGAKLTDSEKVEFNPLVDKSLVDFAQVFGADVAYKTKSILSGLPIHAILSEPHTFAAHVTYSVNPETKKVNENSGSVNHFKCSPFVTSEDRVFLGHEFIHMNKEVNLEEYKLLMVCSDVIPMLYEFITMGDQAYEVMRNRLFLLSYEAQNYEMASKKIKSSGKEKDLYKVVQSRAGQYLNSFYYASVLYQMYKNDPKIILGYMKRVINCEMTTLDMLKDLGIYLVDNNEMYDEQVKEFRGIIRK